MDFWSCLHQQRTESPEFSHPEGLVFEVVRLHYTLDRRVTLLELSAGLTAEMWYLDESWFEME